MHRRIRGFVSLAASLLLTLFAAGTASAHVVQQVGPYSVALGWLDEPAYAGTQNAVQVIVKDGSGNPVADLAAGGLKVVVSTAGQSTGALSLDPSFDSDTGLGLKGEYRAWLIPTVPGDYTFHLTGSIHGQAVDETATSSDTTFDAVTTPSDAQFPVKLPTLQEIATRADRLDARVTSGQDAVAAAERDAASARDDAARALAVGVVVGGVGLVVAVVALARAARARRRAA